MYTLLHKKIKGKPYSIRHYRGFPKLFLENQALLGFHEAKTGVECGSWANVEHDEVSDFVRRGKGSTHGPVSGP